MPASYEQDLTTCHPVLVVDRRGRARPTLRGTPVPRLSPAHEKSLGLGHTVSGVPARCQASALPQHDVATGGQPQETFGVPRSLRHGRIGQDTPEPGQAARSTEPPMAHHQDSMPVVLPLLSLLHCMQTEPRAASGYRDLLVCCYLGVGRHLAEDAPGESLAPYRSVPPLLQTTPSLQDSSTLDTTLPLLDTQPSSADRSQAPPAEYFRTCPPPVWHLRGSTMPPPSIIGYSHPRPESLAVPCEEIESPRQDSVQGAILRTAILRVWPRVWRGIVPSTVAAYPA